jgi:ubiquinone/menaquinone biosynthesis C-methylase UbiE
MGLGDLLRGKTEPNPSGITIEHPWAYELFNTLAFGGRRRRLFAGVVRLSGASSGDRVLDVGCGPGYLTRLVADAVAPTGSVVGIDASASVIGYARRTTRAANCTFDTGVAQALDFPDESFDVVVSSFVLHHLPQDVRLDAVREMFRVLRPGGGLLIGDFRSPQGHLGNHLVGTLAGPAMQHNPVHLIEHLVRDVGFESVNDGDLRPFLHYVRATKPRHSTGGAAS